MLHVSHCTYIVCQDHSIISSRPIIHVKRFSLYLICNNLVPSNDTYYSLAKWNSAEMSKRRNFNKHRIRRICPNFRVFRLKPNVTQTRNVKTWTFSMLCGKTVRAWRRGVTRHDFRCESPEESSKAWFSYERKKQINNRHCVRCVCVQLDGLFGL